MKKISFKKVIASTAALSLVAFGTAAIPASAMTYEKVDKTSSVYIDQVTVSAAEAKAGVPIYVYVNNAFEDGLTSLEFGIQVDKDINRTVVNDTSTAMDVGNSPLDIIPEKADSNKVENFTWIAAAAAKNWFAPNAITGAAAGSKTVLMIYCKIDNPEPGKTYAINHAEKGVGIVDPKTGEVKERDQLFKNGSIDYVADGNVSYVDGWIKIEGEAPTEPPTEPPTVAPETDAPTEPPTAPETDAETNPPTDPATDPSTEASTAASTNASTAASSTAASGNGTGTTAAGNGSSSGSPATGASDVLPIAGAAAAVAVLGGVALVAKKKND